MEEMIVNLAQIGLTFVVIIYLHWVGSLLEDVVEYMDEEGADNEG